MGQAVQEEMEHRVFHSYFLLVGHVAEGEEGRILVAAWARVDAGEDDQLEVSLRILVEVAPMSGSTT